MAHTSLRWILMVLAAGLLSAMVRAQAPGQTIEALEKSQETFRPDLLRRCRSVSIVTKPSFLSPIILAEKLRSRGEFQSAGLTLVEQETADVEITVTNTTRGTYVQWPTSPEGARDVEVFAVRARDGQTASKTVIALGTFEGIVAANAIDVLHQLCPVVHTTRQWRQLGLDPLDPSAVATLRSAQTLRVSSHTSWINTAALRRILAQRTAVHGWRLAVFDNQKEPNDLELEVEHDIHNTLAYRYELLDRDRKSLFIGYVAALSERRAAEKIADAVTLRLAQVRGPIPTYSSERAVISVQSHAWPAKLATGDPRTTMLPVVISIDRGRIVARNALAQTVLDTEAGDLQDVEHSSVRDPFFPDPASLISFVGSEPDTPQEAVVPGVGGVALFAYVGVGAVLTPLTTYLNVSHLVDIAWSDGDCYRDMTLQLRGSDARELTEALRTLMRQESIPTEEP